MAVIKRKRQSNRSVAVSITAVVVFLGTLRLFLHSSNQQSGNYSLSLFEESPSLMTQNNNMNHETNSKSSSLSGDAETVEQEQELQDPLGGASVESALDEVQEVEPDTATNTGGNSQQQAVQMQTLHNPNIESPIVNNLPITSVTHIHEFRENLDKDAVYSGSFCLPWDINADEWFTHHPTWEMGAENDTHYCFQEIENEKKRNLYQKLYQIQFHGNCSNVFTKRMWNSGWSADFTNVVDGLKHATMRNRPVQIVEEKPWHFAYPARKPTKENRNVPPACPRRNMFCYFLPLSNCPAAETGSRAQFLEGKFTGTWKYQIFYEYATRRQTWLRKRIYDFSKQQNIEGPCTAIHVRRGDVVLHGGDLKRRYHAIAEYMEASNKVHKNVYLLTDDKNAINEAKIEFPDTNWMYMDRPRYKAAEGGWEKQIPSNDPTYEVTALLTEFQLARKCDQLIHSRSGFATQLYWEMRSARGDTIDKIDLDEMGVRGGPVHSARYEHTTNISHAYDDSVLAAKGLAIVG